MNTHNFTIRLVTPAAEHKQAALDYRKEHIDRGEEHIHGGGGLMHIENYEDWLQKVTQARIPPPPPGKAVADTYFAVVEDKIVGTISIRHSLNFTGGQRNGHIGYGVRPTERRKGYATQMLTLALEKCRELGINKTLVSCDKDNPASAKTILKCGGALENEIAEDDGRIIQRYWITVT